MEYRKRMIWVSVLLMLLLCVMPAVQAAAADANGFWMRTEVADGVVTASICVNTTVGDGSIELQYDSNVLTFTEVVADGKYVSFHAVNAKEAGVVRIAWVTMQDYHMDGAVHILLRVRFAGESADSLSLSGSVHTPAGTEIDFTALDFSQLEAAIAAAEGYSAEEYTHESFVVLVEALAQAKAVLHNELSIQTDLDAAVAQLDAAVKGLMFPPVEIPTEPTEPTQPATQPTQPTQPATQPTQPDVEPTPDPQPSSGLWIGIVAAIVVAGAAVVVIMKKKEVRK